jgi:CheY-like chemotaxis protein
MNTKKILIIDDDRVVASIYQNKFRTEGYQTETAADGESALEMLRKAPRDLVILDLSLPGMNGVEVLERIRSCPETQALPVIVFSNSYLATLVQAAWKAGATNCLSKAHCTPRQMVEAVHKVFADGGAAGLPAPAAIQKAAAVPAPAVPTGGAPSAKLDMEFQNKLVENFVASAPKTLAALRQRHQTFAKCEQEKVRLTELFELYRLTHSLTGAAGLVGFRKIAQTANALEALLKELHAKPKEITGSTIRTIAHAVDTLAFLVAQAGNPQTEVPASPMILVVDDESISREMILSALKKADVRAIGLDNSTLALQVLEQNCFDLIFLDVEMPKPDGIEVCERLRKMPTNRTTPVVFVTAHSDSESRARSSLSGGNDFIAKPFLLVELAVKAVIHLLHRQASPVINPSERT